MLFDQDTNLFWRRGSQMIVHGDPPDRAHPSPERQDELRGALQANIDNASPAFAGVRIVTLGELLWILDDQHMAGGLPRPAGTSPITLEGIDLRHANLSGVRLSGAALSRANLTGARLDHADLTQADLAGVVAVGARFPGAILEGANCAGADLRSADFTRANMKGASLIRADLRGASFPMALLATTNLSEANCTGVSLKGLQISGSILRGSLLNDADLTGSAIIDCKFDGALLANADLRGCFAARASFAGADLRGANLSRLDLSEVQLTGANLAGADLRKLRMDGGTICSSLVLDNHTKLGDVGWNPHYLGEIDWQAVDRVGEEDDIAQAATRATRSQACRAAILATHSLAVSLKERGLGPEASRLRLREQRIQRQWLRVRRLWLPYLGSLVLDLVSGYGERLGSIIWSYLAFVLGFGLIDFILGVTVGPSLTLINAIILSVVSFHGGGFLSGIALGGPLSVCVAIESIVGLAIEMIFIASLCRRFVSGV